jgi:hypothetical protein
MVRVVAITEADIARAPVPKPSPDIIARAVGGNPLRFRRLGFVFKFHKKRRVWSFSWAAALFRRLCRAATIRPFISSSTILETWAPHFRIPMSIRSTSKPSSSDLMSGQYSDPVRVVAFNTAEQWSADVSQDVAHEMKRRADPARDDLEFVEPQAGPTRQLSLRLV